MKAPRYKGYSVEVGSLARVLAMYVRDLYGVREEVEGLLRELDLPSEALFSTLGRTLARGLETKVYTSAMRGWHRKLVDNIREGNYDVFNGDRWDPST